MAERKIIDGSLALNGKSRIITIPAAEKREDFRRLIADCKRGRIDRVLGKGRILVRLKGGAEVEQTLNSQEAAA